MQFVKLTEKEFSTFLTNHPLRNFMQTIEWANLKAKTGWANHLVGVKIEKEIVAATMILSLNTPLRKKIFYAPRGLLVDFNNLEILSFFTENLKKYVYQENGIFLKIDPNLIHLERDLNGEVIPGGIDNSKIITNLKELGFYHQGLGKELGGTLQPRWNFVLSLTDKTEEELLKEMDQQTRWSINKTLKLPFQVYGLEYDEIDEFKKIMQKTSERREFIDRPLSYYQSMYKELKDKIKILIAELDVNEYLNFLEDELKREEKNKESISKHLEEVSRSKKYQKQLKVSLETIKNLNKKIKEAKELKENYGDKIKMAGAMFILFAGEITYLYSGAYREFMSFNAQYRIQWEMIKYALKNNYERYNFAGISGYFTKEHPLYGIYDFKRGFNGQVEELIGEFDLVVRPFYYKLYNFSLAVYRFLKKR